MSTKHEAAGSNPAATAKQAASMRRLAASMTPEERRKHFGRKHSPETRAKMSASVSRAIAEGRLTPRKFPVAHGPYENGTKCPCAACMGRKQSQWQRDAARARMKAMPKEAVRRGASNGSRSRGRLERAASVRLALDGYELFQPHAVCDRVAIKDGKVYFVEFKKDGQVLRPAQQKVRDAVPDSYLVRYYE